MSVPEKPVFGVYLTVPSGLTTTVPLAGEPGPVAGTVTEVGSSGAPPGVTVSLPRTGMVTGAAGVVDVVSGFAIGVLDPMVMFTVAKAHTGVGLEVSQTL